MITKIKTNGELCHVDLTRTDLAKSLPSKQFLKLNDDQVITMCVLAGCDYSDGIKTMGVVKALNWVRKCTNLDKILRYLKYDKTFKKFLSEDLKLELNIAYNVFKYYIVYDPESE
jgi:5'-3' exonuclease